MIQDSTLGIAVPAIAQAERDAYVRTLERCTIDQLRGLFHAEFDETQRLTDAMAASPVAAETLSESFQLHDFRRDACAAMLERRERFGQSARAAGACLPGGVASNRSVDVPSDIDTWQRSRFTLADAYASRPPRRYVVSGLIEIPSLNIIYGPPAALKSMLVAELAIDTAGGCKWLEPMPGCAGKTFEVAQCPAMWCDFDNGQRRTHEHFEAIARARQIPADAPFSYYVMPSPWLDVSQPDSINALAVRVQAEGAKLLVIDNLGVICGSADENSPEIAHALSNLRAIAENMDTAIILIHHQRKSTGLKTRLGDSLRGHSSIEASLDLALLVEREDGSDIITLRATKTRGAPIKPVGARFTYTHKPGTDELEQARFYGFVVEDTTSDAAVGAAVLHALSGGASCTKSGLVASVKQALPEIGINRIRGVIDLLAGTKQIRAAVGPKGSKIYTL